MIATRFLTFLPSPRWPMAWLLAFVALTSAACDSGSSPPTADSLTLDIAVDADITLDPDLLGDIDINFDSLDLDGLDIALDLATGSDQTAQTDTDAQSDAAGSDADAGTDVGPDSDAKQDVDSSGASDAGPDVGSDAVSDAGSDAAADTGADADVAAESDSAVQTDTAAQTDTSAQTDAAAVPDAVVGPEDATDTDALTADSDALTTDTGDPDADDAADAAGTDAVTPECTGADECDDENACTEDTCLPTGLCDHVTSTAACDDGLVCTVGDTCGAMGCAGTWNTCEDDEICTADLCDPADGCQHEALPLGATTCDDGNVCTTTDGCFGGACNGLAVVCDDANVCTTDSCDPVLGCQYVANTNVCNDNVACTTADVCQEEVCTGTPDNGLCTDNKPCTADTCGTAGCVFTPDNSLSCNDGTVCTEDDHCDGGSCLSTPVVCDDNDACTKDICSATSGCDSVALVGGEPCQDGSVCTKLDGCFGGKCQGTIFPCNDNNDCTVDSCDPLQGCIYLPVEGTATCFDSNPCLTEDYCDNGTCIGGSAPLACSDNDPCTPDGCNELFGCEFGPKTTGACDDGNVCTVEDSCATGLCIGGPLDCDDGLACTTDSCQSGLGCQHFADDGVCQDDLACTYNYCDLALDCSAVVQCNDGLACTDDLCLTSGCAFPEFTDFCSDGDLCTHDFCAAAGVFSEDGCSHEAFDGDCNDGEPCTSGEVCSGGVCSGVATDCNDNNVCTTDSCSPGQGCVYMAVAVTTACEDNNVCTTDDTCAHSGCVGATLDCDDHNACTTDQCHPVSGCFYKQSPEASLPGAVCDDGNPCTTGDTCTGQTCAGPIPAVCDDNVACSEDYCDPGQGGCAAQLVALNCNDGLPCTVDQCTATGCVYVPDDSLCDDDVGCTSNQCDTTNGCTFPSNCNDGVACTTDSCIHGSCQAEANHALCEDGNVCTTNSCNLAVGCTSVANTADCTDGDDCTVEACADKACVAGPATCDPDTPACWQTCTFSAMAESEPNNLCSNAAAPVQAPVTFTGAIDPAGDEDLFAFTLAATSDLVIATYDSQGPYHATCSPNSVDTLIQLYSSDCLSSLTPVIDQGGVGSCSRIDASKDNYARGLQPGTYYVRVRAPNTAAFNYSLDIATVAVCGDGQTEGSEECDGEEVCGANCRFIPVCNNGLTQPGEDCDDGNNDDGDGCSASCSWEKVAEIEPNNTPSQADAAGVTVTGNTNLTAVIGQSNESDYFPLTTTVATVLQLEMTDGSGKTCEAGAITANMDVSLFDATGSALLATDTEAAGMGKCGALTVSVPAGSFYVRVKRSTSGTVLGGYQLQVRYHTAATSEVEPNESIAQATPVAGMRWVALGNRADADKDHFATVTLTAGQSIRAEVLEGGSTTCESGGVAVSLSLYNEAGTLLATDINGGRGGCSRIDGTGTVPDHSGASKLPAGRYYLAITGSSNFDYRLAVTLR